MNQKNSLSILASLIGVPLQDLELQSTNLMGSLGIDSLTATRVRAALIPQPSYQVLYGLIVSEVAAMLCDISVNQNTLEQAETEKYSIPFRLTPMQESYLMGANQGYPCQVYSEFDIDNLNIDIFQQAVQSIVDRHPMLHATIVNGLQQAIHSPQEHHRVYFEPREVEDLDQRRQECINVFQTKRDLYWDIQFTRLSENKVRLHLLLDMLFIDATSAMILCYEVASAYRALLYGDHHFPPVNHQLEFWDYCNQLESKQISPSSLNYWEERFQWMPGPPQLPRLKQSGDQIANFQRLAFCLEENEWHTLKTYALELQITPNALLLAIFSEILRFYSEEPHFSITVTMSERPLGIENNFSGVIGEFTNILLCPIVGQNMPIDAAAQKIHKDLCKSLEHMDFSGLEVLRKLRKYKSDPHLSFPIVFTSFIGVIRPDIELVNCKTALHFQQTQTPQITLDHQVYEWKGKLYVNWDYDINIYEKELMADMLHCFHHLLQQATKDNSCLPSLPPEVIAKRLSINQTNQAWDPAETFLLHNLVFNNANKTPNSIAIIDQDLKFTYKEIIIISRAIAVALQKRGIGPDCCVAVVMEKGWEQVVAILGILLTGAFYLPLDPSHPDERLRHILTLANCKVALVQPQIIMTERNWWKVQNGPPLVTVSVNRDLLTIFNDQELISINIDPDQLAYVIFTSGSTGEPKGVEVTHRGAVNTCLDINKRFGLQEDTVTFAISALNFDLSIWDIFGTLGAGGTIVVCKPGGNRDPDYWWEQLQQHQVTVWNSVPTSFEMLIASRPPSVVLPLRLAFLSGDAISMTMLKNARLLFPDLKIVTLGGATEASIWSNFHVIENHSWDLNTDLAPYGKPLSNQTMYVLDSNGNYRPDRVVGDIYIGGTGLARGYFKDQELTASKFLIIEPFGKLYATGDIGRYLPNGEIEIVGRKDSQVKVGGYRIELAEIACCVERLIFVNKAAVVHLCDKGDRLVGFVTTREAIEGWEEQIRLYIEEHLPNYMAPQVWVNLEQMPLTNNNKIDIKKLRQTAASFLQQTQTTKLVENSSEVALVLQLAAQLIGVSATTLSPIHSLMEQGLSSLLVVQFINLLSATWNARLSYTLIFNYPTAVQLANFYKTLACKEITPNTSTSNLSSYSSEPIAVIGVACRAPGGVFSPEEFWTMLLKDTDCVTDVPSSRFDIEEIYHPDPNRMGYSYTRRGAFMEDVDSFDYGFFNIPIAEASAMDPQQRMFLEVAYEAFYVAGYDKERLKGSLTGVFVGQMNYDWMTDFNHTTDYAGTVVAPSITSNRVSFILDLAGPSMTIDTACSSSLVAVDAAITKLRSGACKMALAGGVNMILCSTPYITTCQARMLSVNSRCATFDAAANGIARGEGAGAVVLKRLSDAQIARDPILAIIRGSCVNQDGKSASLTAPNGLAQEAVIQAALADAGVNGRDIDYVECHGTGTPLGDPIEIEALKNVLNDQRTKPLVLGAVKTNIGHLEGAAGIIGLIKTIEVLRHRQAPPNIHFQTLNPKIDLQSFPAVIPTKATTLGREDKEGLMAGVSSFGYGGTNVHLILQSWDNSHPTQAIVRSDMLWMFTGQGSITAGGARLLYEQNRVFKEALDRYTALFEHEKGISLLDLLVHEDKQGLLQQTQYGQPALVALQLAQISMWQSRGVMPSIVLGHSIGEFAAAVLAGVMQPEIAFNLAMIRGKLMADCPPGSMAAVFLGIDNLQHVLPKDIFIAAENGPSMTVLSGDQNRLRDFLHKHFPEGSQYVFLPVSHAFHSPFMRQAAEAFQEHFKSIKLFEPKTVHFISTLTGDKEVSRLCTADYWVDQMTSPVQFLKAVKTAFYLSSQLQTIIEIGPSATLINMAKRFISQEPLKWVSSHETVKYVPKHHLFQNIRLPWGRPVKQQTKVIKNSPSLENCIYETIWTPVEESKTFLHHPLPSSCLVLSSIEVDISLPQGWLMFVVREEEALLKSVSQRNWDAVILLGNGSEKDVELGLRLLQFAGQNTTLSIGHIFFVTSPLHTLDAGLWGLARTAHQEQPDINIGCIECKPEEVVKAVLSAMKYNDEDEFSFSEQKGLKVPRISPCLDTLSTSDISIHANATYVISGGQGALGLIAAKLLVERGAKHLLLLSRNPQSLDRIPQLASLRNQANIRCLVCNVSQKEQVIKAKDWLSQEQWPDVKGIIHTAGVLTDGTIPNQSEISLKTAFGAKVLGACHLRSVFSPPDFLVLFSSIAALFGSAGQASYAAANAALDALALQWAGVGEPVLSIQWGPWSEVGMAVRHNALKRTEMLGFGVVSPDLGATLLGQLIASQKRGTVCVSPVRWDQLSLKNARFRNVQNSSSNHPQKIQQWNPSDLQKLVRACILQFIPSNKVEGNPSFMEAGFSSLDLVQFRQHLMSHLPDFVELPVHFAFNYPTEEDVVDYLTEQFKKKLSEKKEATKMWTLLNEGKTGTPLFLISGVVGTVEKTFGTLAAAVSRPVYALKPAIPAYIDLKQITLETVAQAIKESMLREVPLDTYAVGGLSFGATLALEVGLQLEREDRLAKVVMIDPRHMPPFTTPSSPAPFEMLLAHYTPSGIVQSPVILFQCAVPPIEKQSEMMLETSHSFQDDQAIINSCQRWCQNLELIRSEGHHFNLLYKYVQPIAANIEQSFQVQLKSIKSSSDEPIAIVSAACRLPGNVRSLEEFWQMLLAGRDCVTEIPYSRFEIDEVYNPNPDILGCSYTRSAAFMEKVEYFDHDFFGISIAEARVMDPQQRLLLEVAYEALYRAGYDKQRLRGSATGVYIGLANDDWTTMGRDQEAYSPYFSAGVSGSIVSNRISYLFGLTGPSMAIDTACSSSLVAVDLAVEKLRRGICSLALVGGVNVMLHHRMFVSACATKALSKQGYCATFDSSADGYCRGEGVGVVVLKRLSEAQAEGDPILAVIRGTAVNQDGRTVSLTAPSGLAQEAVIQQALAAASVKGQDIDYVECHGTGTPLGDPIEVASLKNVLGKERKKPLILGAVKTNIGHLEGAAGVVGLIKAIEVLRHRQVPRIVHFKSLNPQINMEGFNVVIPTQTVSVNIHSRTPLLAGVSSFGFGGTNAHVILESYDSKIVEPRAAPAYKSRFLPWHRLPHPFLGRKDEHGFVSALSGERAAIWQDHYIDGNVLVPAASHITLLGGAALLHQASQAIGVEIHDITLPRPLILKDESRIIHCIFRENQWIIQDKKDEFASCQATKPLSPSDKIKLEIDVQAICKRCTLTDLDPLYVALAQQGVQFGPRYRNLSELFMGEDEAIARVRIKPLPVGERSLTLLHPATLDAGIQLLGLCGMKTCGVCVPFHIKTAYLFNIEDQPEELWAYVRLSGSSSESIEGAVTLFDETGRVFAVLEGLTCRRFGTDTQIDAALFETEWVAFPSIVKSSLDLPREVVILSRIPLDIAIPDTWRAIIIQDITSPLSILQNVPESKIVLLSAGFRADVELGLQLLQIVNTDPTFQQKEVIFVTSPGSDADAGLWGLARTFRLERPDIQLRCIECTVDQLLDIFRISGEYENELSIDQNHVVRARRLRRFNVSNSAQSAQIYSDATYIISGGQGALGLVAVQFLIERGAKHLLLLSRTPKPIHTIPELLELSQLAKIECLACDVSEEENVQTARNWLLRHGWPRVQGVLHTAGVLTDGTIPNQSRDKLNLAFGPKVDGARYLRDIFRPSDFLILFSSAAATFGSVGQASYAAANATLDALAENWAEAGEPVLSIQWGAWSEVGMAVRYDAVKRAENAGFGSISPNLGKAVLNHLLHNGKRGVVCVSPIDWGRLTLHTPVLSRFLLKRAQSVNTTVQPSTLINEMELMQIVRQGVKEAIGKEVSEDMPLMANGMDSLSAVVLAQTLGQKLGLSLGSVFALNYPTIGDMVKALRTLLGEKPLVSNTNPPTSIQRSEEPIAIVGTSCRLPGNVRSVRDFWDMLLAGMDCVTEVPYSRFDIDEVYNPNPDAIGCSYTRHAAFMPLVEQFDCDFFDILVAEARLMDPHQRLLLEVAYEAFCLAGYDKKRLRGSSTGVFVGVANQDWTLVCGDQEVQNPFFGVGVSFSIISNRISYLLGLTGPSMTLDTACSSSLVAVDLAVEKLRSGVCSIALVGGINVMLHHRTFVGCCSAKMLSFKGRCAAFDASADGYCRGEGVGAVVLKRLSDAEADGDPILAVIRGTAVNQDGRSATLTAPNGVAQEAVIQQALTVAGIKGQDIDYIECHGTGTPLGDPIEIAALKNVLGKGRKKPLILGAVKTNIGHLEGAAGIIGLIKTVEVLRHRQAPEIVHFNTLNPKIDVADFNVLIPTSPTALLSDSQEQLLAGVSSFGFGGTNAHVILESYENKHSEPKPSPVYNPRFLPWRRLPHPCLSRVEENGFIVVLSGERAAMWQDHRINGNVFMPAASHVTLLGGAALLTQDPQAVGIEVCDITMLRPLIVEKEPRAIRVILKDQQWSLQDDHEKFANCQTTRLLCLDDKTKADFDIQAICKRCASIEIEPLYNTLAQEGMQFGPRYRNLNELFIGESEAIASVRTTSFPVGERALTLLHPAILDAGIQLLSLCGVKTCGVCVPFHIETARLFSIENQPEELWAYAYVRKASSKSIEGTVTLFDETGQVFAVLEGLTCRRFGTDTRVEEVLFETEWTALSSSTPSVVKALHEVLILSRAPVNISLPPHWRTLIVPTSDTFVLPSSSWSQLIFSVQETESDLELGLTLLQRLAQSPSSLEDKHIVFVVPRKNVMNAGLWGLIRSFRLEHPNVKICCVESTLEYSDQISSLSIKYPYEDEFSIDTNGVVYARRLCLSKRATPSQSIPIHSDATYVITGGQGALGLIVTQFLIEQGAKYLLLLSRTPQPIEKMPELLEMSKQAKIECLAADVAEEQSISKIQEWLLQNKWPHVRGIVHTAGVLTDGTIPNQSIDKLQHAFGPKVQGALNLHPGFPSVDFLILFSSAAATFGSVGQASYSAANAALDALAESWVKAGQPVLSIQWGAWSEVGMAVRHDAVKRAEAAGFGSITSNLGKAILAHLLHIGKRGVVCASPIDWATLKLNTPLINRFRPERKYSMKISSPSTNQYSGMDLLEIVRQAVKASIGKTVADNVPLMANGLDSLSAVILAQTLSQKIGLSLGSVFALNYPTITDMVKALLVQIQKNTQKAEVLGPSNHYSEDPIVVVSAACRVPGNVNSTDEFWEMLMSGTDCVTDIPPSRFDIDPFYDPNLNAIGRSYTRKGAFMSQVESFDHEFFGIPILEARAMDPQQRLLLEVAYEAFYAAGYEKESLYNLPIAVFIGQMNQDWAHMHTEEKIADPYFGAGSAASITSNRISYLLGLTGPSMTLDTACSSSLVAVDLAVEKLRSGVCSAALVGGVNVMLSHRSFVGCCSAKMLSFKGRCATFDASADGYCRGEGVGAVVLKRMKDAQADGNQILAIIRGTAVNQDGRSASLTAPNGLAQEAVIKRALEIAGLKGSDMDYIECHGTGTGLGDPIEVGALKNVLNAQRKKPVVLGAVKTNIGHLEGAAGVVGLIKAIEVLRHRRVPGNVHFKTLNPKIDLGDFPAIISNQPIALELNAQRTIIAGVSSFGFGGTNAHVILESANTYV